MDSDLAQPLVERVKKENEWFVKQLPPQATDSESKIWQHDSESLAENLGELLDGFKTNSRYAQSCEQRAKIGVDEVSPGYPHLLYQLLMSRSPFQKYHSLTRPPTFR